MTVPAGGPKIVGIVLVRNEDVFVEQASEPARRGQGRLRRRRPPSVSAWKRGKHMRGALTTVGAAPFLG